MIVCRRRHGIERDELTAGHRKVGRSPLGAVSAVSAGVLGILGLFWAQVSLSDPPRSAIRVAVVPAISTNKILPTTSFDEFGTTTGIALGAARGEYEPASFVIRNATSSERTIQVVVDDLHGSMGSIGSASVDVKHVLVWYQASGAWVNWRRRPRNMDAFLTPELLVNDPAIIRVDREREHNYLRLSRSTGAEYILISERKLANGNLVPTIEEQPVYDSPTLLPVTIPPHENRQIWVTVHVTEDVEPGVYRGSARLLDPNAKEVAVIPLKLEVYAFDLPAPSIEYSMYYRGKLAEHHPTVSHEWKSSSQLRADLESMIAHGISNPNCYQRWRPKQVVERTSPISTRESVKNYLEIREELGLANRPLYYLGRHTGVSSDPGYLAQLDEDARELLSLVRRFGVTELYLYGRDEAKGETLTDQQATWRTVKRAGARVFAAGTAGHFELTNGLTDLLVYYGDPIAEGRQLAKKQHQIGNRLSMYGNPQAGPEDPLVWRRNYGITAWQADYDGVMPFAFQSQFGSMWNDWDDKNYRTEALAYPAADKPISTLAFEGLREGVDDVRYLTALEDSISRLEMKEALPRDKKDALRDARTFLAQLRNEFEFDPSAVREKTVHHLRAIVE